MKPKFAWSLNGIDWNACVARELAKDIAGSNAQGQSKTEFFIGLLAYAFLPPDSHFVIDTIEEDTHELRTAIETIQRHASAKIVFNIERYTVCPPDPDSHGPWRWRAVGSSSVPESNVV